MTGTVALERRAAALVDRWGERRIVWIVVALAFVARVVVGLINAAGGLEGAEAYSVALSLATRGEFADAFGPGTGPTAHAGLVTPLLMAGVFVLLGPGSQASTVALVTLAALAVAGSFLLIERAFAALGVGRWPRLAALAFVAFVPFQIRLETVDLVIWETAYATLGYAMVLLAVVRLDRRERVGLAPLIALALGNALLLLLNPAVGVGAAALIGLLLLRRASWRDRALIPAIVLGSFLAASTPWQQRNERVLGEPVRTRSSYGLSLAVTYHDGALGERPREASVERLKAVHPHWKDGRGLAKMRAAGGEVPYNRLLAAEARAWMDAHPRATAGIWLRNISDHFFPTPWAWYRWTGRSSVALVARSAVVGALSLAALATILWMLVRRRWRWFYVAAAVTAPMLPYILTYSLLRYRYPVSTILIFAAFTGSAAALAWARGRGRAAAG